MRVTFGRYELVVQVIKHSYHLIVNRRTGDVIGHCESTNLRPVRHDEPDVELREITKHQYDTLLADPKSYIGRE